MNIKILLKIFGTGVYDLTDGEREAADKVVDYFIGKEECKVLVNLAEEDAQDILAACHYALGEEGWDWESVMLSKTRKREIIELRYCIFDIFSKRTNVSQRRMMDLLGGAFDRTTMLHALEQVECWRNYDPIFRALYNRLADWVEAYLHKETSSDEAQINV